MLAGRLFRITKKNKLNTFIFYFFFFFEKLLFFTFRKQKNFKKSHFLEYTLLPSFGPQPSSSIHPQSWCWCHSSKVNNKNKLKKHKFLCNPEAISQFSAIFFPCTFNENSFYFLFLQQKIFEVRSLQLFVLDWLIRSNQKIFFFLFWAVRVSYVNWLFTVHNPTCATQIWWCKKLRICFSFNPTKKETKIQTKKKFSVFFYYQHDSVEELFPDGYGFRGFSIDSQDCRRWRVDFHRHGDLGGVFGLCNGAERASR